MGEDVVPRSNNASPLDPFGLWESWARSLTLYGPWSGPVNQAIQTMLARNLGQLGVINISTAGRQGPRARAPDRGAGRKLRPTAGAAAGRGRRAGARAPR